jgi:hypothetical protein
MKELHKHIHWYSYRIWAHTKFFFRRYEDEIKYLSVVIPAFIIFMGVIFGAGYLYRTNVGSALEGNVLYHLSIIEIFFIYMIMFLVEGLMKKSFVDRVCAFGLSGLGCIMWFFAIWKMELRVFM